MVHTSSFLERRLLHASSKALMTGSLKPMYLPRVSSAYQALKATGTVPTTLAPRSIENSGLPQSPDAHSEFYRGAAPTLWIDVRDRLGEVPPVTIEVLCVVLTLAIHVIRWRREDFGTGLS